MTRIGLSLIVILMLSPQALGQARPGLLGFTVLRVDVIRAATSDPSTHIPVPVMTYPKDARDPINGRYLVFLGRSNDGKYQCPGLPGLCFVDTRDSAASPIFLAEKAYWPVWSGTGDLFAFHASRGGPLYYPTSIYVYRLQRERTRTVPVLHQRIDQELDHYAWSGSPVEDRLLFAGPTNDASPKAQGLFVYSAQTKRSGWWKVWAPGGFLGSRGRPMGSISCTRL